MFKPIFLSLLLLFSLCANANEYKAGNITVHQPWARGGASMMAGYLKLNNQGKADRLLSARSQISEVVELHQHTNDNGVMRMRKIQGIELPAKQNIELKPGGLHLMFIRLKKPLQDGERFMVTLEFEKTAPLQVEFKVDSKAQPTD